MLSAQGEFLFFYRGLTRTGTDETRTDTDFEQHSDLKRFKKYYSHVAGWQKKPGFLNRSRGKVAEHFTSQATPSS